MTTLKGQYTIIDVTDGKDGSNIWTTTTEPVNNRVPLDDLVGPESVEKQVGDIVFYSTFKYYISRIESGYATVSEKVDFKGKDGEDGTSVTISETSVTYQVGESGTEKPSGTWLPTIPPVDEGKYLWTKTEVEYLPSGHTESYSVSYNGTNGNTGWSQATITLYKRSDDVQTGFDGGILNYEFSSGRLTGSTGSWARTIPDGDDKLWVITASAFSQGASDDIGRDEWTPPVILSENGTAGQNGLTMLTVILYQRKSTEPSKPTKAVTYDFTEKTISGEGVGDWSLTFPPGTDPVWVISATASARDDDKDAINPSEWSTVQKLVQNGEKGDPGTKVVNATYYKPAESTSTINSWATSDISFDNTEVYQSDIDKIKVGDTVYIAVQNSDTGKTDRVIRVCTAKSATGFNSVGAGSGLGVLRDGGNGANGYSNAVVYMYKRSADTPSKPTGSFTYTFSTGVLSPSSKDGWTQSVPDGEDKVWQIVRGVVGQNSTATFLGEDFTTPSIISENGTKGADGQSIVNVILYKRSKSTPDSVTSSTTYSWRQGEQPTITGTGLNGWTLAMPTGTDPVYMISATATAQWVETSGAYFSDTIDAEEWSTPNLLAQKGEDGEDGASYVVATFSPTKAYPLAGWNIVSSLDSDQNWSNCTNTASLKVGDTVECGGIITDKDNVRCTVTGTVTSIRASAFNAKMHGNLTYTLNGTDGATGANAKDFSINVSPATFNVLCAKRKFYVATAQTITCSCKLNNISGVTPTWSLTGGNGRVSINSSGVVTITKGNWGAVPQTPPSFTVKCSVSGYGEKTYTIGSVASGGENAVYARNAKTIEQAKAHVEGLYGNWDKDDYFMDERFVPYCIDNGMTAKELDATSPVYAEAMSTMSVDAFSSETEIPEDTIKTKWAYLMNLIANTAVIDQIFSNTITSKNFKPDNNNFYALKGYRLEIEEDLKGIIRAENARFTNVNIKGGTIEDVTIKKNKEGSEDVLFSTLDEVDSISFSAVSETGTMVEESLLANSECYQSTLFMDSGSANAIHYSSNTSSSSTLITYRDFTTTAMFTGTYTFTTCVPPSDSTIAPKITITVENSTYSAEGGKASVDVPITEGQQISVSFNQSAYIYDPAAILIISIAGGKPYHTWRVSSFFDKYTGTTVSVSKNTSFYCTHQTLEGGIINRGPKFLAGKEYYTANTLSNIGVSIQGQDPRSVAYRLPSVSTALYDRFNEKDGTDFKISSGSVVRLTSTIFVAYKGLSYRVTRVQKNADNVTFFNDEGAVLEVPKDNYWSFNVPACETMPFSAGVVAPDIYTKADDTGTIGTRDNAYRDAWVKNMHGNLEGNVTGDVTGNVNDSGTTYKVYGAVFN